MNKEMEELGALDTPIPEKPPKGISPETWYKMQIRGITELPEGVTDTEMYYKLLKEDMENLPPLKK